LRVAINALAVEPRRPGGDVTYVRELVRWLPVVAPDVEWVVFTSTRGRSLFPAPAPGVRYVIGSVPGTSLVIRALWEQLVLPRLVQRVGADVLHAPINVAPVRCAVPVLLTLHEAEPFMPGSRIPPAMLAWWRLMRRRSARHATRVLTVSQSAKTDLVRWMGLSRDKIRVVHLGVDTDRFTPDGSSDRHPLDGSPYILWIGRSYPGKNLARLIAAFAALRRAGRTERLALVGPRGWSEKEIDVAAVQYDCSAAVVRVPPVWDDLARWYRACAAFAYPSTRESFGLPLLEGMACGSPIVASDIPALREVGANAVAYASPTSREELTDKLDRVLNDHTYSARLRDAGPRRAAQFTWAQAARRTAEHYGAVVVGNHTFVHY